jgi:hypothetical protein
MWNHVRNALSPIFKWTGKLDESEWFFIFVAVVVVGLFCLRGFGSRSSY